MPATAACAPPKGVAYRRRQSERTLLYRTVQTHLATWLVLHDDGVGETAPPPNGNFAATSNAASSPTVLPAPTATSASTIF